jgi:hypothetical protein
MMILFRTLWVVDLLTALVAAAFFVIGVADGSVSGANIALWAGLLAAIAIVVVGAKALRNRNRLAAACALAALLAVPSLLFVFFFGVAIVSGVRWN